MISIEKFLKENFRNIRIHDEEAQIVCPFHKDHPPGHLYMSLTTGAWKCHHATCNLSGGFKKFLRLTELIERYNLTDIHVEQSQEHEIDENIQTTLPESLIYSFTSKIPKELLDMGLSEEIIKKKHVGFDEYRYRIVYPIRDEKGTLVGLSGKNLIRLGGEPKYKFYVNELKELYPNYRFNRKKYLYNLDLVYPKLAYSSQNEELYIVEGFKACLWMLQNGYDNTVALMGVPAAERQVELIKQLTNTFVLFLDEDEAGTAATKELADELSLSGTVYILKGDKKQPDDYSSQEIKDLVKNKKIIEELYF